MATLFLAAIMGWYLVIISLFLLVRQDFAKTAASNVLANRGLYLVLAIFTFILGLIMVLTHNFWVWGWPVVVTILAWLVLISGILRLFFPDAAVRWGSAFLARPHGLRIAAVVFLLIGLFLLYHVYVYLIPG